MMRTTALILITMLAACGGEKITPAPKPGDVHHLPPIEWRIVDQHELERVYRNSGMTLGGKQRLHGFVGVQSGRTVIYTLPPARVDDAATMTLGHEVMHVAIGDYHR